MNIVFMSLETNKELDKRDPRLSEMPQCISSIVEEVLNIKVGDYHGVVKPFGKSKTYKVYVYEGVQVYAFYTDEDLGKYVVQLDIPTDLEKGIRYHLIGADKQ